MSITGYVYINLYAPDYIGSKHTETDHYTNDTRQTDSRQRTVSAFTDPEPVPDRWALAFVCFWLLYARLS